MPASHNMPVLTRYDILLGSLTILFSLALFVAHAGKKRLPYPPGPKRLPIVGNLFNMPSREEWVTYRKWSQEFGRTRNVIVPRPPSTEVRQIPTSSMQMSWGHILLFSTRSKPPKSYWRSAPQSIQTGMIWIHVGQLVLVTCRFNTPFRPPMIVLRKLYV
jgi:hypothetical protein